MSPDRPTRVELAPEAKIPPLVIGCWQLSQGHGDGPSREEALELLLELAEAGFDTFDAADIYTGVEELLGELRRRTARLSSRPRIRVHTKLVPDLADLPSLRRRDLERIIDRSRRRLGVDALDLVQFHWWDFRIPGWVEAAGWLDELRREGKLRAIGVTNFDAERLAELLAAGIPVASNQVQYSVVDRRPEAALVDLGRERGVRLLTYGSLAGGFLTDRWLGRPDPGARPGNRSLVKYRLILDEVGGWGPFQDLLGTLREVADRRGVGIAEVASRWVLDRPGVAAVITGFTRRSRPDRYRKILTLGLDEEDRRLLEDALDRLGSVPGEVYGLERIPGGRHAAVMKTNLNAAQATSRA